MSNHVRVIDNISGSILLETSMEKLSDAYSFAALMEEQGLDIRIDTSAVTETLIKSLGASETEIALHKSNLSSDLIDHLEYKDVVEEFGCSICPTIKNNKP